MSLPSPRSFVHRSPILHYIRRRQLPVHRAFNRASQSTMAESPLPIVLCGKTEHIARTVIAYLQPEYETIHLVLTPEAGALQIPAILRGTTPTHESTLATNNYTRRPVAIVLGGGYDDAAAQQMRDACKGLAPVPWLRCDTSKPTPPLGPEYGKAIVMRVKAQLQRMRQEGLMARGEEFWY